MHYVDHIWHLIFGNNQFINANSQLILTIKTFYIYLFVPIQLNFSSSNVENVFL